MNFYTLINRKKNYNSSYDSNYLETNNINFIDNIVPEYLNNTLNNIIKYNKKIKNLSTESLYILYIAISLKIKDNIIFNEVINSYKLHQKYIIELDNYIKMINNIESRKYIYNLLKTKKINNIIIDTNLLNNIGTSKYYHLDNILEYNYSVNNFKTNTINSINKLILISDEIEKNILQELIIKLNNTYKTVHKFNNPEIEIYNKLIDIKDERILYVFNHFTLPIYRIKNHPLYADFFILFNINNNLKFAIIEYDGITHYNINDFRFRKENIICDTIKNNYCLQNNINILRIKYNNKNINIIKSFINNIFNDIYQAIIESKEYYDNLLNKCS